MGTAFMTEKGGEASEREFAAIVCTPDKLDELLSSTAAMGIPDMVAKAGGPISGTRCDTTIIGRDFNCGDSD